MGQLGGTIAWEGVAFAPVKGTPYMATSIASRAAQTLGIGPFVPRFWSGVYSILVSHPSGEGLGPAYEEADRVLRHFPRGLSMTSGGLVVTVESATVRPSYSASDWVNVPVQVSWYAEEPPA